MPRARRIVLPGVPHHITQRGNNKQVVFFNDDDRRFYLDTLHERCKRAGVQIWSYCLMPNHSHFVAVPSDETGLAAAFGWTHRQYAQRLNVRLGRSGHVWQERFFSVPMDAAHTVAAMRYIEQNPVRAGIVDHAWEYPWSSAAAHCGIAPPHPLIRDASWDKVYPPHKWKEELSDTADCEQVEAIRQSKHRGRPLGSENFIANVEAQIGRRVRPRPRGRPPKK